MAHHHHHHHHVPPPPTPAATDDHDATTITTMFTKSPRRRKSSVAFAGGGGSLQDHDDDHREKSAGNDAYNESLPQKTKKKMIHRDVERQRREETKAHYASLRSLLPIEYLKGKRSISDQVHQAAIYICHQEAKIREMSRKRDQLMKLIMTKTNPLSISSSSSSSSSSLSSSSSALLSTSNSFEISVRPCLVGVEVVMGIGLGMTRIIGSAVSIVFGALAEEGFNIGSYISTRVGDKMLHSIKAEVCGGRSFDAAQLQGKLTNSLLIVIMRQTR